ncbi:short-chain dehydrogenase [Sphingomonas panacis]|uniref:Peroxisomal trans-2-enoyl-CoA reductase n=2 Tax=Sphingomonas panacis TaxID=1560345 RepID=A0A1B3ZHQ8_9SPHN|nr:short-chain dehydrogenase [Sphingomonas panacis]
MAERRIAFNDVLFRDKVVLVSGGATGIGRALVWILARSGARVVTCGRSPDKLDALRSELADHGHEVLAVPTDIRNADAVAALFAQMPERHGRLDLLINNAGGQFPQAAIDMSANGFRAVIDNNLLGTWSMMQTAARHWRDTNTPGSIVNVVAVVDRGILGAAHTAAARAGVIYLSKTVAVEWMPLNIRVNCVAPGTIFTEGMAGYPEEAKKTFARSNPMLRLGDPWEIAEACLFIGSDASSFTTGEILRVDGGGQLWGEQWTQGKPDYFAG